MTVILVTQDSGVHGPKIAASIAAGLGLDLVSQQELGHLVAARMQIKEEALQRLVDERPPLFARWLGERRRLAWCTADEIINLARHGDMVVESWNSVGSLCGIRHGIRVHVGHCRRSAGVGAVGHGCRATISPIEAASGRRWVLDQAREVPVVCDLVLAAAPQSVASCVHELRRLTLGQPLPCFEPSGAALAPLRNDAGADDALQASWRLSPWVKLRGRRALQVEIGPDRMPLTGVASSEQAIAQIELHLQGKGDRATVPPKRLPLPPPGLF
ncbi:MAG TPA: hypothetical protein VFR19_07245 [Hyphomicrobiaceae bacterium]|jgi:hypothetical protein|nr:hypothetical protein [Hyphomicrobiaceae bacterium]